MKLISPKGWKDYELIDSGNGEKLERFGKYVLARPEPQALWDKGLPDHEWDKMHNAWFSRNEKSPDKGIWNLKKGMPDQWWVTYALDSRILQFRLGLTSFKHVGLFPEQADNWHYLFERLKNFPNSKVLNLFAYTGGASLAARAAGASVVHLDSVKQVITWARENMEKSRLSEISWVIEDALKFVRREAARSKSYQGIILDPPAYGRGPKGEKWVLEDLLPELLKYCHQILARKGFLILNLYSMGLSPVVAETLIKSVFANAVPETGELYFEDRSTHRLPLGSFCRFSL